MVRMLFALVALTCGIAGITERPAFAGVPGIDVIPAQEVYRAGDGVTLPRVLKEVKPDYTPAAKEKRIAGSVWLAIVVTETGDVGDVEVTRSLDKEYGLDDEAVKAARQWKFDPGRKGEKAVPVQITLEMTFTLR